MMGTTQKSVTLTLTERAGEEVKKFLAEEKVSQESAGLRVAVLPGGCSGFRYSLNIEERPAADDVVIESAGVRSEERRVGKECRTRWATRQEREGTCRMRS